MADRDPQQTSAAGSRLDPAGTAEDRRERVCIIGAGPAGLAMARALTVRGIPYDQLERHTGVGGIWDIDAPGSPIYDSAHFISSRTLSGFGGYPMSEDLPDYPSHRQVLAYLRGFADAYDLTPGIELGVTVTTIERQRDDTWLVQRQDGRITRYRAVVCCSGTQWTPNLPPLPGEFDGELIHSRDYRSLDQVRGRRVLVIGGGNSGCDIVVDASRVARSAVISMRRGYWFIPKHVFGVPSDVFAERGPELPMWLQQRVFAALLRLLTGRPSRLGLLDPDHRPFETHPVLNSNLFIALQHGDVRGRPGIARVDGSTVTFVDGTSEDVDLIISATGYRRAIPYAQRYVGSEQHPDLYLTSFSREHPGLYGVGFIETNSGAFGHFDELAQMIASHLDDQTHRPRAAAEFRTLIESDRPDLTGGIRFVRSPRHLGYVDAHTFRRYRKALFERMGWRMITEPPTDARRAAVPAGGAAA